MHHHLFITSSAIPTPRPQRAHHRRFILLPVSSMPPVRLPLMDASENTATPSPAPTARRRSGRQTRAPEKFQPEPTIAPKRKRGAQDEEDDAENHDPEEDHVDLSEEDVEESSAEEDRPRTKKKPASQPSRAKKPAAKKPKINGAGPIKSSISVGLPSRPKPKKTARVVTGDARDGDGVYGEHFCTPMVSTTY